MQQKNFIYLVQCEGTFLPYPELVESSDCDVLYLSWKKEHESMTFFPNSTWTEGRNKLYQIAKNLERTYEFYIFLDDDIRFEKGSFGDFQDLLLEYNPAIATPYYRRFRNNTDVSNAVHSVSLWDPCINAFHKSVFLGGIALPYLTDFDNISWWYSGYLSIVLSLLFYDKATIQFNTVIVQNLASRPYPRTVPLSNWDKFRLTVLNKFKLPTYPKYLFVTVDRWISKQLLLNTSRRREVIKSIRALRTDTEMELRSSYEVSSDDKSRFLRHDFLTKNLSLSN